MPSPMPMGRMVGSPSSVSKSVRWSPGHITSMSGALPSQPERPKKSRSCPSLMPSMAARAVSCQLTGYWLCLCSDGPAAVMPSVGSHSAKSFIQPSAPRAMAACIFCTAQARAAGLSRSSIPVVVPLAPVKV